MDLDARTSRTIGRRRRVVLLIAAMALSACASDDSGSSDDVTDDGSSASRCTGQVIHNGQLYEFWSEADQRGAPLGEVETAQCFDLSETDPPVSERGSGEFVKAYTLPGIDESDAFMTQKFGATSADTKFFVFARIDANAELQAQLPKK